MQEKYNPVTGKFEVIKEGGSGSGNFGHGGRPGERGGSGEGGGQSLKGSHAKSLHQEIDKYLKSPGGVTSSTKQWLQKNVPYALPKGTINKKDAEEMRSKLKNLLAIG